MVQITDKRDRGRGRRREGSLCCVLVCVWNLREFCIKLN